MRAAKPQTNFNAGELSPRIFGRIDVDKYYNGVARMKNFIPLPFGGAQKTPGTMYANEVRDSAKPARLMDWTFNSRQAYILQFNDGKIRFYKDQGVVYGDNPVNITGITNANPGVVTAVSHGFSNGALVTLNGIDGMEEVNGVEYAVANVTADTFELTNKDTAANINTTSFGTFIPRTATVLLLNFEGDYTDSSDSGHTVTANGDAVISTTWAKFGTSSVKFDGAGYLTTPDHADYDLGTAAFCIDVQMRFRSIPGGTSFTIWSFTTDNTYMFYNVSLGQMIVYVEGVAIITAAWSPVVDTNYHIALIADGSNGYTLTIDGVSIGTGTSSATVNASGQLEIGAYNGGTSIYAFFDAFRITKGYRRFTAPFTPPTGPSPITNDTTVAGVYEITHEYLDADIFEIQKAQTGDISYLTHEDHPPQKLSRFGDASWTIADTDFQDGPYLDQNDTATTLDPSGTSGSVTVVASAITGINPTSALPAGSGFQTTDIGRLIRYWDGASWFWMKITARASTTSVTATIQHKAGDPTTTTMAGHAATATWRLGAWSDTTGFPRSVTFFQGRSWYGGTEFQPDTLWGSVSFDYENMNPGTAADADAVTLKINSAQANVIQWLASGKRLIVGTDGEIFTVYSGTAAEPITPTNLRADSETNYGSNGVVPVKIGSYNYYVQGDGKTMRELYYDFGIDSYRSINKSILSEHITRAGIKQIAYQKSPFGVIYAVLDDGKMATLTREIEQEVNGWADQTTRSGDLYKSVAVIPVDGYDEAWFVVSRVINGSTKQYVEFQVNPNQDVDESLADMVLMQSALTFEGSASTITGLEHLEGATVSVLAGGTKLTKTVASGSISLGATYTTVHVGLPVTAQIKLLPLEAGSQLETAQGMQKHTSKIVLRVNNSLGIQVGTDGGDMESILTDHNGAEPTTLQTGVFDAPSSMGWDTEQQMLIECADPYPATVLLAALYEFTSEEKT